MGRRLYCWRTRCPNWRNKVAGICIMQHYLLLSSIVHYSGIILHYLVLQYLVLSSNPGAAGLAERHNQPAPLCPPPILCPEEELAYNYFGRECTVKIVTPIVCSVMFWRRGAHHRSSLEF